MTVERTVSGSLAGRGQEHPGAALSIDQATLFAPVDAEIARGADIPDERYRYLLWRRWDDAPPVLFVMLNPSTADAEQDDPTIRRCIGFARRWGAGGIRVVNLYPWRATRPCDLPRGPEVFGELPLGHEHNARAIDGALDGVGRVVAAWGANPGPWPSQPSVIAAQVRAAGHDFYALGVTKNGQPRHPLYMPASARPMPWTPKETVNAR